MGIKMGIQLSKKWKRNTQINRTVLKKGSPLKIKNSWGDSAAMVQSICEIKVDAHLKAQVSILMGILVILDILKEIVNFKEIVGSFYDL